MREFAQFTVNGITTGSIYALIAVGFSLVWSGRRTLNFAHGAFHMVGAYTAFLVLSAIGDIENSSLAARILWFVLAVLAGVVVGFALAGATYAGIYWPLRRSSESAPYIATLGFAIVLAEVVHLRYPSDVTLVPQALPPDRFEIGGVTISYTQVGVLLFAFVLMFTLDYWVRRTRTGRALRAMAADDNTATLMGVNTEFLFFLTLVVASAIAVIAGVLVASYFVVINPYLGLGAAVKGLTAAVLGGLGNLRGAVLGGLVLGLIEAHSTSIFSGPWKDLLAMTVLIVVLLIRPAGLFGTATAGAGSRAL